MLICPFSQQEAIPKGCTFRSSETMTCEWTGVLSEVSHVDHIPAYQRSHFSPVPWTLRQVALIGSLSLCLVKESMVRSRKMRFYWNGKSLVALVNILPFGNNNKKKDCDMKIVDGTYRGRQVIIGLYLTQIRSPYRLWKGIKNAHWLRLKEKNPPYLNLILFIRDRSNPRQLDSGMFPDLEWASFTGFISLSIRI